MASVKEAHVYVIQAGKVPTVSGSLVTQDALSMVNVPMERVSVSKAGWVNIVPSMDVPMDVPTMVYVPKVS